MPKERLKVTVLYDSVEDQETDPRADTPVYRQVQKALEGRGHEVKTLAAEKKTRNLVAQVEKDDSEIIFNLCESLGGVDRHSINVASLLELLGKPFTGAGALGLSLAQDKAVAKKLFSFHGIPYPRFSTMDAGHVEWSDDLSFPLFVKPLDSDSSIGIDEKAIVGNVKELMERISYIHTHVRAPALVEEYIEGREIYVSVLGNDPPAALPIVEWDFSGLEEPRIATAEAKWNKDSEHYKAPEIVPQDLPAELVQSMQRAAVEACRTLRVVDYARVDIRLRKTLPEKKQNGGSPPKGWEFFVIEVNPNPYLDQKAEFALAARKQGLSYPDLIERIIDAARRRKR